MRRPWAWVAGLAALAALGVGLAVWAVTSAPGPAPRAGSVHVLIALALAVVGAGGLTAGLMWLAFFSARAGYDDRADFRFGEDEAD